MVTRETTYLTTDIFLDVVAKKIFPSLSLGWYLSTVDTIVRYRIMFFSEHSSTVLMKVPEVCGFDRCNSSQDRNSPFRKRINTTEQIFNIDKFARELSATLDECICDTYNICQSKASEILLFMLSDSDRMKLLNDDTKTHVISYSLPVDVLNQMVEYLRNILKQYNIPVMCESFSG